MLDTLSITHIGLSIAIIGTVANLFLSILDLNTATSYISYIVSAILLLLLLANLGENDATKQTLLIAFAIAYLLTGLSSGNGPLSQSQIQQKMHGKKTNHPRLARFLTAIIGPLVFGFIVNYTLVSTTKIFNLEDVIKKILTNPSSEVTTMSKVLIGASLGSLVSTIFSNTTRYISGYTNNDTEETWQKLFGIRQQTLLLQVMMTRLSLDGLVQM